MTTLYNFYIIWKCHFIMHCTKYVIRYNYDTCVLFICIVLLNLLQ